MKMQFMDLLVQFLLPMVITAAICFVMLNCSFLNEATWVYFKKVEKTLLTSIRLRGRECSFCLLQTRATSRSNVEVFFCFLPYCIETLADIREKSKALEPYLNKKANAKAKHQAVSKRLDELK